METSAPSRLASGQYSSNRGRPSILERRRATSSHTRKETLSQAFGAKASRLSVPPFGTAWGTYLEFPGSPEGNGARLSFVAERPQNQRPERFVEHQTGSYQIPS